jgi:hypothetical protein
MTQLRLLTILRLHFKFVKNEIYVPFTKKNKQNFTMTIKLYCFKNGVQLLLQVVSIFFKILFTVYILFLAVKPCVDDFSVSVCCPDSYVHIENKHTDEHQDGCSAVCICICSSTTATPSQSYSFEAFWEACSISLISADTVILSDLKAASPPPRA